MEMVEAAYGSAGHVQAMGHPFVTSSMTAAAAGKYITKAVRLFGVKLTDQPGIECTSNCPSLTMRKCLSMGNLNAVGLKPLHRHGAGEHPDDESATRRPFLEEGAGISSISQCSGKRMQKGGYLSDGLTQTTRERRKGVPWTEEEHRLFLAGLQKLGKGDWRGISRKFVITRTPTQVASHAQKYFLRQCNVSKRKRRSSLFDIISYNNVTSLNTIPNSNDRGGKPPVQSYGTLSASDRSILCADQELRAQHLRLRCTDIGTPSFLSSSGSCASPGSDVSAELCLGQSPSTWRPQNQERNCSSSSSCVNVYRKREFPVDEDCPSTRGIAGTDRVWQISKTAVSSSTSPKLMSSFSSSSSSSSPIPVCRTDETSELSSLSLSIGLPSVIDDGTELALTLEPPMTRSPVIFASTEKECPRNTMLLIAGT
ncbi:hypothetical protein KP509_34G025300 [Ceratopteris richardii]|uniref:Uncharacterized protein n=1 Tax=Ceratopteris richardii TaxID=49495 RepID=A0A8T2QK78_CERRI|nr:hypothetical protein KP509_34G025300 [Ceratopteris richardii]